MKSENKKLGAKIGGVVFTGCLFIGLGVGKYLGHTSIGLFIGMGIGFLLMGAIWTNTI
ncbi:MAG: hypothetical protein ABII90_04845 [Bacteroidota bacterium]